MRLSKSLKDAIKAHALDAYPHECCGLIVRNTFDGELDYIRMANISYDPANHFEIDPAEYAEIEVLFAIEAIVHSHPDGEPMPSEPDRVQMALHGVPWVIASVNHGVVNIRTHKPKAYTAPLVGREYVHGLQDCYSLVRDYYERECGLTLSDYPRAVDWWEDEHSPSLYVENFKNEGFVEVPLSDIQKHDVIICRVGRTYHPNHALIYLGDSGELASEKTPPIFGKNLVIHHPHGRNSVREIFGENWAKRVAMVVRHQSMF